MLVVNISLKSETYRYSVFLESLCPRLTRVWSLRHIGIRYCQNTMLLVDTNMEFEEYWNFGLLAHHACVVHIRVGCILIFQFRVIRTSVSMVDASLELRHSGFKNHAISPALKNLREIRTDKENNSLDIEYITLTYYILDTIHIDYQSMELLLG